MVVLDTGLAQDIVTRTMRIIPFNVNVMDANGTILASGTPSRIGELHAGALLALAKKLTVEIDAASAKNMHGARPGINLPLMVNGQVCGAVGLSGSPDEVRQFGALVQLTAEMILEQANLTFQLQRDFRYREAFLLNLIRFEPAARADLEAWGHRLGIDFQRAQLVFLLELDGAEGSNLALDQIQRLQMRVHARHPACMAAAVSPGEMLILDSYDPGLGPRATELKAQRQLQALTCLLQEECGQPFRLAVGIASAGIEGAAISYQSAKTSARVGQLRNPQQQQFSYYDLALPVLLAGLGSGWQAQQLRQPSAKLQAHDKNGMLARTLDCWFANDGNSAATAKALHIHRNTLDYRLRRIGEVTGLDVARTEDRFLLYVAALLASL